MQSECIFGAKIFLVFLYFFKILNIFKRIKDYKWHFLDEMIASLQNPHAQKIRKINKTFQTIQIKADYVYYFMTDTSMTSNVLIIIRHYYAH